MAVATSVRFGDTLHEDNPSQAHLNDGSPASNSANSSKVTTPFISSFSHTAKAPFCRNNSAFDANEDTVHCRHLPQAKTDLFTASSFSVTAFSASISRL